MQNKPQSTQPPLKFSMKDARDILCECGHHTFMPGFRFKKMSKLLTGAPQDSTFPIEVFLCVQCGKPLQELLPDDMKTKK